VRIPAEASNAHCLVREIAFVNPTMRLFCRKGISELASRPEGAEMRYRKGSLNLNRFHIHASIYVKSQALFGLHHYSWRYLTVRSK
jgi:hypothetical protein